MKRKVRVSYSDPDVTYSSSDEGGDGTDKKTKRMVHEIVLQPEKNLNKKKGENGESTVLKSETLSRRLGTYNTAEESSKAYLAKKLEIEEKLRTRKGINCVPCEKSSEESSPTVPEVDTSGFANETNAI
ncbi:AP2/ERF domain-containing protein [Abeliophyllum distichum]|uniref:AP2/ERF domain-containing protein n=1 Tax=Abeliophyllum distichum TaxID=126358 RepID=A0ABD1U246_9LAMI